MGGASNETTALHRKALPKMHPGAQTCVIGSPNTHETTVSRRQGYGIRGGRGRMRGVTVCCD